MGKCEDSCLVSACMFLLCIPGTGCLCQVQPVKRLAVHVVQSTRAVSGVWVCKERRCCQTYAHAHQLTAVHHFQPPQTHSWRSQLHRIRTERTTFCESGSCSVHIQ